MLNSDEFLSEVLNNVSKYMPDAYMNIKFVASDCVMINRKCKSISAESTDNVRPILTYSDVLYDIYKDCESVDEALSGCAEYLTERIQKSGSVKAPDLDFESLKDNLILTLVNTEKNKDLLETIPHRQFLDLSIIYRWMINVDSSDNSASMIVTNNTMMNANIDSEEKLYELAMKNTRTIFSEEITDVCDVARKFEIESGMSPEEVEAYMPRREAKDTLWVLTNNVGLYGASLMNYEDILSDMAEKVEDNLFILPSSIHEVLLLAATDKEPCCLKGMVTSVNEDMVSEREILSDNVYFYDRTSKIVSIAEAE